MKSLFVRLVMVYLTMVGVTQAQTKDPWTGKRVFTQYGTVLKVGDVVVDDEKRTDNLRVNDHDRVLCRVYRVEHVKGEWLWLQDEKSGIAGWVQTKYVIPYEQAIDYYTTFLRSNPQAYLFNTRGTIWHEKAEYDIAIADYNEAIRLDPKYASAYNNRGVAWGNKKEYDKAIADYNEAIRLDPKYAEAYSNRGSTWRGRKDKDYDKAIADYSEAIRLDPKVVSTYISRGSAWWVKQEYDKAIADYNEAIRLDPNNATAYSNRGIAWSKKKEYDKAIADYDESIRLEPKYAFAYYTRADAWRDKKEYDKAIADYNEVIRLDPKDESGYNRRAWIWATCPDDEYRDGKKAVESATRACELTDWKDVYKLGTLAAAYAETGDFAKAVEWQEKAHRLYSDDDKKKWSKLLDLYRDKKPYRDTD